MTRLADAGAVRGRQDQHGRVRHGLLHRDLGLRHHPQPARHDPGPRRVLGRIGRRRGRRLRPAGPRLRHRRVDPPAGRPVRGGGHEADLRHRLALRAGGLRLLARPDRPVRHHGGRRRPALRRHRRPRPSGLDLAQPAHPPGPVGARRRGRRDDRRHAHRVPRRRRPRRGGPGATRPPRPWPRPGPASRRSRSPRSPSACPPTTSSPRARPRPTWPATTACATGSGSTPRTRWP